MALLKMQMMCRRFRWFDLLLSLKRPQRLPLPQPRSKIRARLTKARKSMFHVGKGDGGGEDGVLGGDVPKSVDGGDGEDHGGLKGLQIHSNLLKYQYRLEANHS